MSSARTDSPRHPQGWRCSKDSISRCQRIRSGRGRAVRARSRQPVEAGQLAYLGQERQALALRTDRQARLLLLGGDPFAEPILLWWNFVARSRAEVEAATREWNGQEPRFGSV